MEDYSALFDTLKNKTIREAAKAVVVIWYDIWDHPDTWVEFPLKEEDVPLLPMTTLGYIVHADSKVLVVAGTVDLEHNMMSQVCVIPNGCIKSITVL